MRDQLLSAWRARRVLLLCGASLPGLFMQALLTELGARPARISPGADAAQLNRAMTEGRIGAVIVPQTTEILPGSSLPGRLSALLTLLGEAREAGVPLAILCSDADVYRAADHPWAARETDPIGGETNEGLMQSILQLTADGVSRGLLGDAVSSIIVRHPPCLGCGHSSVAQPDSWCDALDAGEIVNVAQPGRQNVFVHPLDMCCGVLALGARFLLGDRNMTGVCNLGVGPENLIANRTAALRLIRRCGGTRPIRESETPSTPTPSLPDGSKARFLCGAQSVISGDEALGMLLTLRRAQKKDADEQMRVIREQTQVYLQRLN